MGTRCRIGKRRWRGCPARGTGRLCCWSPGRASRSEQRPKVLRLNLMCIIDYSVSNQQPGYLQNQGQNITAWSVLIYRPYKKKFYVKDPLILLHRMAGKHLIFKRKEKKHTKLSHYSLLPLVHYLNEFINEKWSTLHDFQFRVDPHFRLPSKNT